MALVNPNNNQNQGFNPNVDNSEVNAKANTAGKVLTYLSFILIIPIFIYIGTRNRLVRLQMKINEASSGIDVQLKKRRDTLVKLVDASKSSMKFEKDVLTDITKMRAGTSTPAQEDAKLSKLQSRIFATFEAYPNLKTPENIAQLMSVAEDIEREISASRRLYNSYVNEFNTRLFT